MSIESTYFGDLYTVKGLLGKGGHGHVLEAERVAEANTPANSPSTEMKAPTCTSQDKSRPSHLHATVPRGTYAIKLVSKVDMFTVEVLEGPPPCTTASSDSHLPISGTPEGCSEGLHGGIDNGDGSSLDRAHLCRIDPPPPNQSNNMCCVAVSETKRAVRSITEHSILSDQIRERHPSLPLVYATGQTELHCFAVMKCYSKHGSISKKLPALRRNKLLSWSILQQVSREVLEALCHLHRKGYLYRDVKTENVLIGDSGHVVLTDFDSCRRVPKVAAGVAPSSPQRRKSCGGAAASGSFAHPGNSFVSFTSCFPSPSPWGLLPT
jgi:serine/threonine protein kinase